MSEPLSTEKCNTICSESTILDLIAITLSFFAISVDICLDVFLVLEYFYLGYNVWATVTLCLIIVPCYIVQYFSLKWHIADRTCTDCSWCTHFLSLGIFQRLLTTFILVLKLRRGNDANDLKKINAAQNDLGLLHLFHAFLESAPQLVLQLYIMAFLHQLRLLNCLSVTASSFSLTLALLTYARTQRKANENRKGNFWPGVILQVVWRLGMLLARICAFVILLLAFEAWFLLFLLLHWFAMFIWIIYQNGEICNEAWEERCYNAVAAFILCLCFFNFKEGRSRWRLLSFQAFVVLQNLTSLTLFLMFYNEESADLGVIAFVSILGGTVIGTVGMICYYRFFHSSGPLMFCEDATTPPALQAVNNTVRSLKRPCNNTLKYAIAQTGGSPITNNTHSESKLALSDSIVIVEESDMEEIRTLQTWIKEAASENDGKENSSSSQPTDLYEGASSVLSTHDYENLAAVNIARAAGIRSWRGYCDIDTWAHDDSVGRSSSTTTTSQDYLDSIAEDYADCKTQSSLHTILEESESNCSERGHQNNNACALVATIDQIRIATPVQEDRQSRVRRTFSLLRERFENNREPPPPTAPWTASPSLYQTSTAPQMQELPEVRQTKAKRTFSVLRGRFESAREPSPATIETHQNISSPRFISVKDMRLFFLKQVLTPPRLNGLRRKMVISPS